MKDRNRINRLSRFLAGWLAVARPFPFQRPLREDRLLAAKLFGPAVLSALIALGATAAVFGLTPVRLQTTHLRFAGGKTIIVDLAMTPQQQELGLMFRNSLPKDYGMLFVFPSQRKLQFWMKNTWVDLDMIFLDHAKKIVAIYRNVPRSYPETPEGSLARRDSEAQYVLELPSGASDRYRLTKGQRVFFTVPDSSAVSGTAGAETGPPAVPGSAAATPKKD